MQHDIIQIEEKLTEAVQVSTLHHLAQMKNCQQKKAKFSFWIFFFTMRSCLFIWPLRISAEYLRYPLFTSIIFINEQQFIKMDTTDLYNKSATRNQTKIKFVNKKLFYDPNFNYMILNLAYYNRSEMEKRSFENMLIRCQYMPFLRLDLGHGCIHLMKEIAICLMQATNLDKSSLFVNPMLWVLGYLLVMKKQ